MEKKTSDVIHAIKGFEKDLTCRGFQFEPGKTYTREGEIKACRNGFHSCPVDDETPPHAVFEYYAPGSSRYFDVTASGATDRKDNKIASASIAIGVEITMGEIMRRVAEWCARKAKGAASNSGYYGAASNSGIRGAASNSGYGGAASNSGNYGAASNSGECGAASNSGNYGAAINSGTRGAASNSGNYGAASNSGYYGAASNSGYGGAASNSGNYGAASNSGTCGAASNSGYYGAAINSGTRGAASNSGNYGAASNSGYYGAASNSGYGGAAFSTGYGGKVMSEKDGCSLHCDERDQDYNIVSAACGITGRDGIEAGVWYVCRDGKLVAA